jgi:hypothetical protein
MTEAREVEAERMDMPATTESEHTDVDARDEELRRADDTRADDLAEPEVTSESTTDFDSDTELETPTPTPMQPAATTTGTGTPMPTGGQHTATTAPVAATHGDTHRHDDDWRSVQASFVDDPADAVQEADALVGRLIDEIIREREALSGRNTAAGETEELRQALREYRRLYQRLVPADRS